MPIIINKPVPHKSIREAIGYREQEDNDHPLVTIIKKDGSVEKTTGKRVIINNKTIQHIPR